MGSREGLRRWPQRQPPRALVREAVALVQRYTTHGCTPEEVAQARATLAALDQPRQPALPLRVKP